jgi:hypothetical protein
VCVYIYTRKILVVGFVRKLGNLMQWLGNLLFVNGSGGASGITGSVL